MDNLALLRGLHNAITHRDSQAIITHCTDLLEWYDNGGERLENWPASTLRGIRLLAWQASDTNDDFDLERDLFDPIYS